MGVLRGGGFWTNAMAQRNHGVGPGGHQALPNFVSETPVVGPNARFMPAES